MRALFANLQPTRHKLVAALLGVALAGLALQTFSMQRDGGTILLEAQTDRKQHQA
jgi:hypothetical protein